MRLFSIERSDVQEDVDIHALIRGYEFDDLFLETILLEGQEEYLQKKYPDVSPELIQQAITLDRKSAEKLVLGLQKGVISQLDNNAVAAVANLDPFAKVSNKSEADLAYEAAIKKAKAVNPKYWQWILRHQKENPDAAFDEGWFHYLEGEEVPDEELKKLSPEEVRKRSEKWHEEQFANQKVGGDYKLGPQSKEAVSVGPFYWVPVPSGDDRIEGQKMQNCIGTYCKASQTCKLFSMRNKFNNPHVSMSIKNNDHWYNAKNIKPGTWVVHEIKGKQNQPPVDKYIPYVVEFVDRLLKKGAMISPNSDFWNFPVDFDKYSIYFVGDVVDSAIVDKISDENLNRLIAQQGLGGVRESIVKRLMPELAVKLLADNPGKGNQWDPSLFVTLCIKYRKISEEQAIQLMEKGLMQRGAALTIQATYHPHEFIKTLETIPVEDFVAAYKNYKHAIEAYNGRDEVFTKIATEMIRLRVANREILQTLYAKIPTRQIMTLMQGAIEKGNDELVNDALKAMEEELTGPDFEAKFQILSLLPSDWTIVPALVEAIIYSTSLELLPQLYRLGNKSLNVGLLRLMRSIKELSAEQHAAVSDSRLSGVADKFIADADQVLAIDDEVQLRNLRAATKSRGVKMLIDRKLARMRRLANVV